MFDQQVRPLDCFVTAVRNDDVFANFTLLQSFQWFGCSLLCHGAFELSKRCIMQNAWRLTTRLANASEMYLWRVGEA